MNLKPMVHMASLVQAMAGLTLCCVGASAIAQSSVHEQLNTVIARYGKVDEKSMTNPAVKAIFSKDGFAQELQAYPVGKLADGFVWKR